MGNCLVCQLERYIEARLLEEGLNLADFQVPVIMSRLHTRADSTGNWTAEQVLAGEVPSMEFWRAVYGPAYPAAVSG